MLLTFLLENWLMIILVVTVLWHRKKLLWEPLAGGNGHVQMDELAKFVIIGLLIFSVYVEATRENLDKQVFTDTFYLILLGGVFSIASIKPMMSMIKFRAKEREKPPETGA